MPPCGRRGSGNSNLAKALLATGCCVLILQRAASAPPPGRPLARQATVSDDNGIPIPPHHSKSAIVCARLMPEGVRVDIVKGNMGWIEVIVGPMFSGKSEELIRRLRRAEIG